MVQNKGSRRRKNKTDFFRESPANRNAHLHHLGMTKNEYQKHVVGCKKVKNMHSNKMVKKKCKFLDSFSQAKSTFFCLVNKHYGSYAPWKQRHKAKQSSVARKVPFFSFW